MRGRTRSPHYPREVPVRPALLRLLAAVATVTAVSVGPSGAVEPEPSTPSSTSSADPDGIDDTTDDTTDDDTYDAPLDVTIDGLSPGVLPRTGPLVVQGTVTNVDLETWRDVRLYPLFGVGPDCTLCGEVMTTSAELAEAAEGDPEVPVGERYTSDDAVRASVTSLEPGASATYTIRIPQRVLRELFGTSPASGVYWFGVHALGSSDSSPRDENSDGRARTFLPVLANRIAQDPARQVPTAVVVPLRARIAHAANGSLIDTGDWATALGQEGELGGPLAFGAAAGSTTMTWLLDPAVPDAVRNLALGNPERAIESVEPEPTESPSGEPTDDAGSGGDASDDPTGSTDGTSDDPTSDVDPDDPLVAAARAWLDLLEPELADDDLALLPYGDPDMSALGDSMPSLYPTARAQASGVLSAWEVTGLSLVGAPDGLVDEAGILAVDDGATLLLGDRMFRADTFTDDPPTGRSIEDRPVVATSTGAAEGGPLPEPRLSSTALRQRILSEAVVRALAADATTSAEPLVVVLPATLQATGANDFWAGLEVDGLRLVGLDEVGATGSSSVGQIDPAELTYPDAAEDRELAAAVLAEASRLIRSAGTLQDILGEGARIEDQLVAEALTGTSYAMRDDAGAASRLAGSRRWVESQLAQITIDAPAAVTLSGESGSFNVAVSNDLDHAVTVQVLASTDAGATIEVAEPVALAAHSRTSVPVSADTTRTGVHNVTLRLTDSEGNPLGGQDTLPLRTGQAGVVIWAIMGTGLAIVFGAIVVRLARRIRRARQGAEVAE